MTFVSPVSTIPVVKAYLVAAITARPEIVTPTLVTYGEPGKWLPNDIVAVMDSTQTFEVMAMVGSGASRWLSENYSIDVQVDCFGGGDDPQTVEERALALAAVVVDVVRVDPQLGGLVLEARPLSLRTVGAFEEEHKGRRCQAFLSFQIFTQL